MTEADVAELFALIAGAFPNSRVTAATGTIYRRMLVDLDREKAHAAVCRLLATAKFMPTIAEIRGAAVDLELGARRAGAEAWGDVGMAVRRFGRYQDPEFTDPLVAECVRSFGWHSLCDSTNDVADRARFVELYDQLSARQRADQVAGERLALPAPSNAPAGRLRDVSSLTVGRRLGERS